MFKNILWLLCLFLFSVKTARAQVLTDPALQQTVLKTLDAIYGGDFAEADTYVRQLHVRYPQHPAGPLLRAIQLHWQYIPLSQNHDAPAQYVQACEQALTLTKKRLEKDKNDPESVFSALAAHGYLALKHHNDDALLKAVNEAGRAYGYMKQGFELMDKNPEFYFTTGMYNYYVERYPMDHPIVKPMIVFFRSGDMPLGIRQLETAARRATFTRYETAYYLANLYLTHENKPNRAAIWLKTLSERFPANPVFLMRYTESVLLSGRYEEAKRLLPRLKAIPRPFLSVPIRFFAGFLAEKEDKNDSEAAEQYRAALRGSYVLLYTKEYHAMAYAGLARMAARANNRPLAKDYYQKALKLTDYESIKQEAKMFK